LAIYKKYKKKTTTEKKTQKKQRGGATSKYTIQRQNKIHIWSGTQEEINQGVISWICHYTFFLAILVDLIFFQ